MRKKTLERVVNQAVEEALTRTASDICAEVITVVEVSDYQPVQEAFERNRVTLGTQRAEIAQLRMLLREALGLLERSHLVNKTISPDFARLSKRAGNVLDNTTLVKDTPNE